MMKSVVHVLSALLVLSMLLTLPAAALAEGYAEDQFFEESKTGETVYTVQVSATTRLSGAEALRAKMLEAGFDCFLYQQMDYYVVMCGKFESESDAQTYRSAIVGKTDRKDAYVTTACLPVGERAAFEAVYTAEGNVVTKKDAGSMKREAKVNLALAADTFAADQLYVADQAQLFVYTVQVSAHAGLETAQADRDRMLAKGYDSFVYQDVTGYFVMCGKFPNVYEALCYGEAIHTDPERYGAYVTSAWLPEEAVSEFTTRLGNFVTILPDSRLMETYWEEPTGPYYRADGDDTVEVYTVKFSEGSSFAASERNRDKLTEAGFPSFVYKTRMVYKIMSGMFTDRAEAERYCQELCSGSDRSRASVTTARIPMADVEAFQGWYAAR